MNANERKVEQSKITALEIIAQLYRGELTMDLELKTQFITGLLGFEHSISSAQALLITVARRDNFKDDKVWASWCEDRFGFTASHRCHMVQAGRLLLDMLKKLDLYQFLFRLDMQKLISLERIDRLDLPDFLKANDVEKLNRDQVRDAVNNFLGQVEPTKSFPVNPAKAHQPDLFDMVDSVCSLRKETIISSVDNKDKAYKFIRSGLSLYGAGMDFLKNVEGMEEPVLDKFAKVLEEELETLRVMKAAAAGFKLKAGK